MRRGGREGRGGETRGRQTRDLATLRCTIASWLLTLMVHTSPTAYWL